MTDNGSIFLNAEMQVQVFNPDFDKLTPKISTETGQTQCADFPEYRFIYLYLFWG